MTLQEAFEEVEDHRRGPAQRHDLKEIIVMAICAVLCGADGWVDIADWCEGEEEWLKTFLVLKYGTPSHDTFGDVFRVLDAAVFGPSSILAPSCRQMPPRRAPPPQCRTPTAAR